MVRFRLGTRGSALALVHAHLVQGRAPAEIGGKALWTKELDRALLDGDVDTWVQLSIRGTLIAVDGEDAVEGRVEGTPDEDPGAALGADLLARGPAPLRALFAA